MNIEQIKLIVDLTLARVDILPITEPKLCCICDGQIPKNRLRYMTCSTACATEKSLHTTRKSDTESELVARVSAWLVRPWRVTA